MKLTSTSKNQTYIKRTIQKKLNKTKHQFNYITLHYYKQVNQWIWNNKPVYSKLKKHQI